MKYILRLSAYALIIAISASAPAFSQDYEYSDYKVKKGDTLWGISKKMIKDPFQWPLLWRENQAINNPDRIYPGQTIKVPVSLKQQEEGQLYIKSQDAKQAPADAAVAPEQSAYYDEPAPKEPVSRDITPMKAKYITTRQSVLENGYVTTKMPYVGEITGNPLGRKLYGLKDEIYIKTQNPASKGDRFYVIRRESKVKHPFTGDNFGFIVKVLGVVEADEDGSTGIKARVVEAYTSMNVGEVLDAYYEFDAPFSTGGDRRPQISATILASPNNKVISGTNDLVFIDKGSADGIMDGDLLMTLLAGTDDRQNGLLQIVDVREHTSLALIKKSTMDINIGDIVSGLKP